MKLSLKNKDSNMHMYTDTRMHTYNFQSYKEVQCSKTSIPNINLSENLRQPSSLCFPSIASGMTTKKPNSRDLPSKNVMKFSDSVHKPS